MGLRGPLKLDNAVSFVKHGHHNSGHSLHHLRLMLAKHSQIRRQLLNLKEKVQLLRNYLQVFNFSPCSEIVSCTA